MDVRFPKALRRGDKIAVLTPSSPLPENHAPFLERGMQRLRDLGYVPELTGNATARLGYLAGSDEQRIDDLMSAMRDPDVRGIFCVRGGYGVTRILDRLDFAALARDPKPILGYSDITGLLAAAWQGAGVVGFHGPNVATPDATAPGEELAAQQHASMTVTDRAVALPLPEGDQPHVIREGSAEGRLVGGNLTLVCSLLGTRHAIETRDCLVFLEDIGEAPYRVDRMLTQLRSTGHLERCAGVILGDFHLDDQPQCSLDPEMQRVFVDRLGDLKCPVAYGFPFGHRPRSWTLPFGVRARLLATDRKRLARLELMEPAVR
ncbi:MAG: LD-carboxypeptidase [Planctomycetota bacterium]